MRQDKKKTVCNKETVYIAKLAMPFETRTYAYTLICLWCFVHYRKPKIRKIRKDNKNVFRKRKIFNCILFSILTLGIYYIYWEYLLVKNTRAVQKIDKSCAGEIMCLLFIPFYSLFWWLSRGKIVKDKFTEHGYSTYGNENAYLMLGIFGLSVVSMSIMQNDFNSLPTKSNK